MPRIDDDQLGLHMFGLGGECRRQQQRQRYGSPYNIAANRSRPQGGTPVAALIGMPSGRLANSNDFLFIFRVHRSDAGAVSRYSGSAPDCDDPATPAALPPRAPRKLPP